MKQRKWIITALLLLLLIPVIPSSALAEDEEALDTVKDAVPSQLEEALEEDGDRLNVILDYAGEILSAVLPEAMATCGILLTIGAVGAMCSSSGILKDMRFDPVETVGVLTGFILLVSGVKSFVMQAGEMLDTLSISTKALLPILASSYALAGSAGSSGGKYIVSMVSFDILVTLVHKLLLPLCMLYLVLAAVNAALPESRLQGALGLIKWGMTALSTVLSLAFTLILSITGIFSGGDSAVTRLTRSTISHSLPVVGGVVSGAAGAITTGAQLLLHSAGWVGLVAVLGAVIGPVLRLGVYYLMLKLTKLTADFFSTGRYGQFLSAASDVFGLLLGLCGMCALIFFLSIVSFMKVAGV